MCFSEVVPIRGITPSEIKTEYKIWAGLFPYFFVSAWTVGDERMWGLAVRVQKLWYLIPFYLQNTLISLSYPLSL